MLIKNPQLQAASRPLAGFGAGAFLCEGAKAGSHGGEVVTRAVPRNRWSVTAGARSAVSGGYLPVNRIQIQTAQANPVFPGGVGPHPVREPEPV
jgi:hypothetical protein